MLFVGCEWSPGGEVGILDWDLVGAGEARMDGMMGRALILCVNIAVCRGEEKSEGTGKEDEINTASAVWVQGRGVWCVLAEGGVEGLKSINQWGKGRAG